MDTIFPNKIAGNCEMRVSGEINVNKIMKKNWEQPVGQQWSQ